MVIANTHRNRKVKTAKKTICLLRTSSKESTWVPIWCIVVFLRQTEDHDFITMDFRKQAFRIPFCCFIGEKDAT